MAFANLSSAWDHNGSNVGGILSLPLLTTSAASTSATQVFKGSIIEIVAATGYCRIAGDNAKATGTAMGGIATEDRTWTIGEEDGSTADVIYIPVWTKGEFDLYHSGAAVTDIGAAFSVEAEVDVYGPVAVTDYANDQVPVGICVGWTTNRVRLKIDGFACAFAGISA
jgi:hypothetical protein